MGSNDRWPPKGIAVRLVQPVIQIIVALAIVWIGVGTLARERTPTGILILAFGGITAALAARQLINRVRSMESGFESSGELATDEFDYIVWTALGLPVLLGLGLLIIVLTGSR